MTNNEDIRYVENRIRTNRHEINQSIKKSEDLQVERNNEILKDIKEIKDQNNEMKNKHMRRKMRFWI